MAITITYTFVPNTTALSAEVNANFSLLASRATDKTGDTLTGTLNTQHLLGSTSNTYDLGGTSNFYRSSYLKTSLVLGQTTANYTLTWANPASARAISFEDPGGTDVLVYKAAAQTLTNKTLSTPLVLNTPTVNTPLLVGTATGSYTMGGTGTWNAGALTSSGVLTINAIGTHPISGGANSLQWLQLTNTTSGTAARSAFTAMAGTTSASLQALSQGYTTAGSGIQAGAVVDCDGAGGISVAASHASGDVRLYSRNTLALTLGASQAAIFAGAVTSAAAQPGFLAYNSADDVTQANTATVDFNAEDYDVLGNFAADIFTAPVAGYYLFTAGVMTSTGSATQDRSAYIVVNGIPYQFGYVPSIGTASVLQITGSVVVLMSVGHQASVTLGLSTGTATVVGNAGRPTFFSGRLLV